MTAAITGYTDEAKLRQLAVELARDIHEPAEILRALGLTEEDYEVLKETRAFQTMYQMALAEWNAAANTPKRVKLKAATMTEEVLPLFYADLTERKESLNARVGLLTTLAKIGGLGQPEPVAADAGNRQFFKLEIHLAGRNEPIVINASADETLTASSYSPRESEREANEQGNEDDTEILRESPLAAGEPYDEF